MKNKLFLGGETVITDNDIIGIFDIEKSSISKDTREFLKKSENNNQVVNVSYDLPRSFVVCSNKGKNTTYISQISTATLRARSSD